MADSITPSPSASSTTQQSDACVTIRQLHSDDKDEILRISKGIYFGHDYLPCVLDEWMSDPNRTWFGIFVDNTLAGLEIVSVYDFGRNVMFQALRVDESYRGLKLSSRLVPHLLDFVKASLPNTRELRSTTTAGNQKSLALLVDKQDYRIASYHPISAFATRAEQLVDGSPLPVAWDALEAALLEETTAWARAVHWLDYEHAVVRTTEKLSGAQLAAVVQAHPTLASLVPRSVLLSDWYNFDLTQANLTLLDALNHTFFVTFETRHGPPTQRVPVAFSLATASRRICGLEWWVSVYCAASDTQALTAHFLHQLRECYSQGCVNFNIVHPDCRILHAHTRKLIATTGNAPGGKGLVDGETLVTMWKPLK